MVSPQGHLQAIKKRKENIKQDLGGGELQIQTIDPTVVAKFLLALGTVQATLGVQHDAVHPGDGLDKQDAAAVAGPSLVARGSQRRLANPFGQLLQHPRLALGLPLSLLGDSRCRRRLLGRPVAWLVLEHVRLGGQDAAAATTPKHNRLGVLARDIRIGTHHVVEALRQDLGLSHLLAGQAQPVGLVALASRVDPAAHAAEQLQLGDKACVGLDEASLGLHHLVGGHEVQVVTLHHIRDDG